ncbi:MAG: NAD(P)-dependent oxidoreductase [Stellaceae bacterium]
MQVGFIGIGAMGSAMAANLLKAGHALTVYNRSPAKAEPFLAQGATVARMPAEAASGEIVITMLADDAAVEAVVFGTGGILAALAPDAVHISMSTISFALAKRLAAAHGHAGQRYVSAPVFGRPDAAANAKLFVMAGGAPSALATCQPLFDALGQRTFIVAAEAEKANLVKLAGNFLITTVIESLGETFALMSKAGVDRRTYLDILTNTLFAAPVYKTYGGLIAEKRYKPAGFKAWLGYKDVRLALEAAEELQAPLPVASLIHDRFLALLANGDGELDWSALASLAERDAGVPTSKPS